MDSYQRRCLILPTLATISIVALVAGCNALPAGTVQSGETATAEGRFLHQFDVATYDVAVQTNLPNVDSCRLALIGARGNWKTWAKQELGQSASQADLEMLANKVYVCSAADKSQVLPYRATIRAKANGLLIDMYSVSLEQCQHTLGNGGVTFDVVAPCAKY